MSADTDLDGSGLKATLNLQRKSIREYSENAGHDLSYRIDWR